MQAFFIGFFLSMIFSGFVLVVCNLKNAFRSGFSLGD